MSFRTMAATRQKDMKASIALDATRTRAAALLGDGFDGLETGIALWKHARHKELVKIEKKGCNVELASRSTPYRRRATAGIACPIADTCFAKVDDAAAYKTRER
jgi:hypothetical protein